MRKILTVLVGAGMLAQPVLADAQTKTKVTETQVVSKQVEVEKVRDTGFVEITGAYGFQFGETDYLPSGAEGQYEHPFVHGYGFGATAGVSLANWVNLTVNYEYTQGDSRTGELDGVFSEAEGEINYQTAVVGLRVHRELGRGMVFGEVGVGAIFPFQTTRRVMYDPALSQLPDPITGIGKQEDEYGVGPGAQGLLGYQMPVTSYSFVNLAFKVKSFESNNNGERTNFSNFITDFGGEGQPPMATTGSIQYDDDGGLQPSTNSVQDVRLQLSIGANF